MVWDKGAPTNATRMKGAALFWENAFFHAPMAAMPAMPVPNAEPRAARIREAFKSPNPAVIIVFLS
jgi:hypothetical protein